MTKQAKYFLIAAHLLVFLLLYFSPSKPKPFGDKEFHWEALMIIKGMYAGDFSFFMKLVRAPAPTFFYTIPYLFVPLGSSDFVYWIAGFPLNVLLTISCSMFFLRSVARAFNPLTAYITGALLLIFPIHIYYAFALSAECLAAAATLLILGYTLRLEPGAGWRQQRGVVIPLLLSVTLLVLSRPNAVLIYPVFFGLAALLYLFRREAFRLYARPLLVPFTASFVLGFLVLKIVSLQFVQGPKGRDQNGHMWYVIHEGHYQYRYEPLDWRFWEKEYRGDSRDYQDWEHAEDSLIRLSNTSKVPLADLYKELTIKEKLAEPLITGRQFFMRLLSGQFFQITRLQPSDLSTAPFSKNLKYFLMVLLLNSVNLVILAFAFITLFRNKGVTLRLLPAFSLLIALFVFHGLVYMETRYLLPARFLLILLAALALTPRVERFLAKRRQEETLTTLT